MAPKAEEQDLKSAIAEALEESKYPTEEVVEDDSWDDWPGLQDEESEGTADSDTEEEPSKGEAADEEAPAEGEKLQLEVPSEYWGVPLDGIPAEQAQAILAKLQQQDGYIHQLQARLSTEPPPPESPDPPADAEEVTDEALLQVLGFDPEDFTTQQLAPHVLPLARTVLSLEDRVEQLVTAQTTEQVKTQWNSQLDELEQTYGKLPVDRLQVLRYAVEEGVSSPFEAYFRLSAPAKKEVEAAVREAQQLAAKKAASGGVKPRTSAGDAPVIDPKTTSLRDATKAAMLEAEKETGLSWKGLFAGKKVRTG